MEFNLLLSNIKNNKFQYIDDKFKLYIDNVINDFFPKLNKNDIYILSLLTNYIIDIISIKYNFDNNEQWKQNNDRDIKGAILLLLPFINDKNNDITDLNHILYSNNSKNVDLNILNDKRESILSTYFKFSNMGIGLLEDDGSLELYKDNTKLIYIIMNHILNSLIKTLEIINGKSYINWINIVPFTFNNYINSKFFINTNINYDNIYYNGLWKGDFYNVLRNYFYEDGKKVKWLFYPYESNNRKIYLIQRLNELIDIDSIISSNFINFDDLLDNDKIDFKKRINNIYLNNKIDFEVIKYYLIYVINDNNIEGFDKFKLNINKEEKDDDFTKDDLNKISKINNDDIINTFEIFKKDYYSNLWTFMKKSLNRLKYTTYWKFLITNNKVNNNYYYKPFANVNITINNLNLKNIYNIAKTLSHTDSWDLLEKNYIKLETKDKNNFITRLNSNFLWLKLGNNLRLQHIDTNYNYNEKISNIINEFKSIYKYLIFEELISNGVLSYFVVNKNITEKNLLPDNYLLRKKKIKELLKNNFNKNKDWLEAYYYLSNEKFKDMKINYFDSISNQEWTTFYAMNWISQISFYQHYIFHNILYVTGATGQGKTTQVPKLLLYSLKMIDYKTNGKIACTQPGTTSTENNAERIAEELGYIIKINNKKTNNYYIQFKHQKNKHIQKKVYHPFLKLLTDGTLLEELRDGDIKYDIIIIDEAHQHNTNMDILIALIREILSNDKKLIIVSATMDDDEPIYRRYFKNIKNNVFSDIESIYIDRRYHISPPGETTQYKIIENYIKVDIFESDFYSVISKRTQEMGYKVIKEICATSIYGHILFFANGLSDILKAVEELNKILPPNVIALPYYAEMNQKYKDIIDKINIRIKNIKNLKQNIHLEWGKNFIQDKTVPDDIYNRAVIIATNVAEASLTFPDLVYVVDNGFAKVNYYDPILNLSTLTIDMISEASRLQRKGRVGRVGDGVLYYLYEKNARSMIKPKYKITQENPGSFIIKLLDNYDMNKLLDVKGQFYLIHPLENNIDRNILNNIIGYNKKIVSQIPFEENQYILSYL